MSNSRRDWKQCCGRDRHTPPGCHGTVHHCEGAERNQGRQDRCCPHLGDWQDHDLPQAKTVQSEPYLGTAIRAVLAEPARPARPSQLEPVPTHGLVSFDLTSSEDTL